jgi:tetratricopeptide (TPR) repeat protein
MSTESASPSTSESPVLHKASRRRSRWRKIVGCLVVAAISVVSYAGWKWQMTRQFRQRCDSARLAQDWRTQRKIAGEWAAWDPLNGTGWWYAAEAAQKLDDLEDMAQCLGNVPSTDPNALVAVVEKANLEWTALNQPVEALQTSLKVLSINPRILEIQSRVVSFYAMNLQRVPMIKSIRTAMAARVEPQESYVYLVMADNLSFGNGAAMNSRWLSGAPDEVRFKVGLAVNTATSLSQNASLEGVAQADEWNREALKQLQWFHETLPHDPVLLGYLMHRAYQAADVDQMGELLQLVDDSSVEDHMVWVYRGWYYQMLQKWPEAETAIREALRLYPISPLAHHEYAKVLRATQRPEAEVVQQQKLAAIGRELRSTVQRSKSAVEVSPQLLKDIAQYAEECGDRLIAESARFREMQSLSAQDMSTAPALNSTTERFNELAR